LKFRGDSQSAISRRSRSDGYEQMVMSKMERSSFHTKVDIIGDIDILEMLVTTDTNEDSMACIDIACSVKKRRGSRGK
jgi:hypothetical protein